MAITVYKVDQIRKSLDKYKRETGIKTDTGAIAFMVNEHHDLVKQLKQARAKIQRLESKVDRYETERKALSSALAPFITRSKQND